MKTQAFTTMVSSTIIILSSLLLLLLLLASASEVADNNNDDDNPESSQLQKESSREGREGLGLGPELDFDNFDNLTSIDDVVEKLMDSDLLTFFFSLLCTIVWVVYITFYSSRITGLLVTKVVNRFCKEGYIKIGSLSFSVLSGKIMFRDVSYISEDCSYRVQDGWVIFRWWRTYVPKDISEDMSHSDTRLSILLNGFEYHLYNRSALYSRLEKLFGLDALIIPGASSNKEPPDKGDKGESNKEQHHLLQDGGSGGGGKSLPKPPSAVGYSWRDLIPVIKLELSCGRVVFGNPLVPYTLALVVEEAHLIYTTKPAASKLDHFMHIVKCKGENFKVLLSQSPKYTGLKDDPPRLMGEGFGILTANKIEFYYYMDEPGVVPNSPEMLQLANGDLVEANPPIWGIDIKCGKGTDFSYGPWADRQRDQLYKLFYPQDYSPLKPTPPPVAGELRQIQSFDIGVSTLNDATIDILFSRDQETNAIHMNVAPGSYLEITIPWIVHSNGYATKITGQLLHVEASTSLQFRNLIESETFQFNIECNYPLHWNDHQDWIMNLTGCKASAYLIFAHKWFFQAMVNDWSSRTPPDLLSFVPYTWKINFILKEFEIITATNEYNWIDCSSQHHENSLLAACGELFELSFDLPFHEFLPPTVLFKFWIQIEGGDLNFLIPEVSSSFIALHSLHKNGKIRNRDGSVTWDLSSLSQVDDPTATTTTMGSSTNATNRAGGGGGGRNSKVKKWRNICQPSESWIECWSVPICAVSIGFTYHPMPPLGPSPQADVTTPEKEENLLSPMRIPGGAGGGGTDSSKETPNKKTSPNPSLGIGSDFDPLSLPPDHVHVECEVGPSVLMLYGSLLKIIINLKENIFGDYQDFIDMEKLKCGSGGLFGFKFPATGASHQTQSDKIGSMDKIDPREYRPLEVTVSATLHDIRGHLIKNCTASDPPCPTICVERFGFEMDKKYAGTILQVLLSPIMLLVTDTLDRFETGADSHLKEGYLMLSGLQVRGHAMFSNEGRSLDQETLEYGWLVEVQLGKLSGRLTTPHVENVVSSCEAFLLTVLDEENSLRSPHSFLVCHHGNNQFDCPSLLLMEEENPSPSEETIQNNLINEQGPQPPPPSTPRINRSPSSLLNVDLEQTGGGGAGASAAATAAAAAGLKNTDYSTNYANLPSSPNNTSRHHRPISVCPTAEDIKYKLVRLSFDAVDVYLVENGSALSLWISPVRFALCNLHGSFMKEGFSLLIPTIQLRHFVMVNPSFTKRFQFSDLNILASSTETMTASWTSKVDLNNASAPQSPTSTSGTRASWSYLWLEAGAIALGPLTIEMAMKGNSTSLLTQNIFLVRHDKKTKRLWFLWKSGGGGDEDNNAAPTAASAAIKKCGCVGGCAFFGSNIGGSRFFWPSKKDWIDGVNVACFRVNKPGEDYGFGQSILKSSVLMFDTPPYTTQQGVMTILELPTEWTRDAPPKMSSLGGGGGGKERGGHSHYVFKPSLLADLSHTSSSVPSTTNRSDKIGSTLGSTLQSSKGRRASQPTSQLLKRQRRISDNHETQGESSPGLDFKFDHSPLNSNELQVPCSSSSISNSLLDDDENGDETLMGGGGRTSSCCSESKLGVDYFQSFEEDEPTEVRIDVGGVESKSSKPSKRVKAARSMLDHPGGGEDTLKKNWRGSVSSLDSLSDLSFISALSVQEECMVNLQMHLNKPITESSLLMPCYMSHLTQLKCDNWHATAPAVVSDSIGPAPFIQMQDGKLIYAGSKYTPYFEPLVDGFTTLAMMSLGTGTSSSHSDKSTSNKTTTSSTSNSTSTPLSHSQSTQSSCPTANTPTQNHFWETGGGGGLPNSGLLPDVGGNGPLPPGNDSQGGGLIDTDFIFSSGATAATADTNAKASLSTDSTTIIVRTKNDINIMVSPMLLEALKRFIEAITPTLSTLHPLTVVNHLHNDCIARVEKANLLKKEKSVILSKIHSSKRNTALRSTGEEQFGSPEHSNLYEEIIQTAIQGSILLPKINVTLLQASVVEEVISFSALDNIRDLMCVSLLAVAIEKTHIHFLHRKQLRKSVQVLQRPPTILPSFNKGVKKRKSKVSTSDSLIAEPVFLENSETQSELLSTSVDIHRIHGQLRRLKNDSSILKEAVITAIPNQHSKVLFKFAKLPNTGPVLDMKVDGTGSSCSSRDNLAENEELLKTESTTHSQQQQAPAQPGGKCPDEKLGFIMFECGLEGICLKGVKNSEALPSQQQQNKTGEELQRQIEKEESLSVTICNEVGGGGGGGSTTRASSNSNSNLAAGTATSTSVADSSVSERDGGGAAEEESDREENTLLAPLLKNEEELLNITTTQIGDGVPPEQPELLAGAASSSKDKEEGEKVAGEATVATLSTTSAAASVSCVIQFKVMWYNFAAPPQTPITRKIDYTRVDWNLVSTASTAINAWLNPIDQLTLSIVSMLKGHSRRSSGLLASLMAEALDCQSIHQPIRSKYSKLTPLAKTLQEDPSCQLCIVLQRYIRQTDMKLIENNVSESRLPPLSTLRQGVIVLSRQWKNVLYTPLLLEHNLKSRKSKNFTVTFTLPQQSEEESPGSDAEMSVEETTDERATLLDAGGTSSLQSMRFTKQSKGSSISSSSGSGGGTVDNKKGRTLPSAPLLNSTRASDVYPLTQNFNVNSLFVNEAATARTPSGGGVVPQQQDKRSGSIVSILTGNWSLSSDEDEEDGKTGKSHPESSGRSTPGTKRRNRSHIVRQINDWTHSNEAAVVAGAASNYSAGGLRGATGSGGIGIGSSGGGGGMLLMSEQSHEESLLLGTHSKFPQHPSLMLLDAHVIFQPLLTSLGLMPHQIMGYSLDHLGSHMSIKANIDTLRVDIVESEGKSTGGGVAGGRASFKGSSGSNKVPTFVLNISPQTPAFLCEGIGLEGDFQKSTDLTRDVISKKSVIYLSRNYWKKQAKSAVIFSLNIDYISQQVNMPLLRLLHQITTMYQNVRETQMELREQRPSDNVEEQVKGDRLHHHHSRDGGGRNKHSSSGSGSDIPDQLNASSSASKRRSASGAASSSVVMDKLAVPTDNEGGLNTSTTSSTTKGGGGGGVSGSSGLATRTQSFAQRFKSSAAMAVRGSKQNMDGGGGGSASQTPTSLRGSEFPHQPSPKPDAPTPTPTPTPLTAIPTDILVAPVHPNCWRTIYYLLDLYATRPETKTIINNRPQVLHESTPSGGDPYHLKPPSSSLMGRKDHLDDAEKGLLSSGGETLQQQAPPVTTYTTSSLEKQKDSFIEPPRFSIFVVARIQRTRLLASLSGLKLEAEIMNLQATSSYNRKMRPVAVDMSLTGHVGQAMIVLLEGIAPNQQTVVRVSIAKSAALYSGFSRRSKDRNSGLLSIGPVHIDIPQHPVVLHGMMTRSTKQLSNTLQEFRVNRSASRISRGTTFDEADFAAHLPPHLQPHHGHGHPHTFNFHHPGGIIPETSVPEKQKLRKASDTAFFQPLQMTFSLTLDSLSITASLLPSLQAQYKMDKVKSCGVTGSKAKFQINLPGHSLSFTTKISVSEANLPSAASIALPHIDVTAEYIQQQPTAAAAAAAAATTTANTSTAQDSGGGGGGGGGAGGGVSGGDDTQILDGVLLRHGSYLSASANIGSFEHCLTTDLLNHLLFVQKVFMKEVNEVVLKMSGGDKPVPLWDADEGTASSLQGVLFTLGVRLQGIQITATTPTNTAVRLETGLLEFQMSNRVQGMSKTGQNNKTASSSANTTTTPGGGGLQVPSFTTNPPMMNTSSTSSGTNRTPASAHHTTATAASFNNKVFVKATVDVNLSLGQLIRNVVFEEADSEYQQYAFFKTRIALRNALSEEISGADADKEVVLITLTRPLIYVQPIAVDKAILVWLNYKSAYEYWNEQRSSLNTEVLAAMPSHWQHERAHIPSLHEVSSTLFLQLTVDDMGVSIPLNPSPHAWTGGGGGMMGRGGENDNRGAVVLTLESTSISACSSGSLVSKGKFTGLCFRFTDDMVSMDDWKPNFHDPSVMNFCVVSEGTYEVCSKTTSQHQQNDNANAKWFLNVKWQMEGVDMHVDVNVGKQLSALGHTLTTLAAFEEDDEDEEGSERENLFTEDVTDYSGGMCTPTPGGGGGGGGQGRSISQESVVGPVMASAPPMLRRQKSTVGENLPSFLTDPSLGPRQKRSLLEKEMQERVNLIEELQKGGASTGRIEEERKRLQELENFAFRDFRRDWIKKLRRQSTRASSKFGLGSTKPLQMRSKSLAMPTPESEKKFDVGSPVDSASPPSTESSPPREHGPSRSHSLRFRTKQRVTFGETQRQFSVDSANLTTPDEEEYAGVWLDNDNDNPDGSIEGKDVSGHLTPGSSVSHTKAQEPNVDLELDVKVFINSGKCVLHTKPKEEDAEQRRKRSERSGSGFDSSLLHHHHHTHTHTHNLSTSSPLSTRKLIRGGGGNASQTRIKSPFGISGSGSTDVTVFHIPGLDVKVHYDSHILYEEKDATTSVLLSSLSRPTHERSDSGSSSSGTLGGGGGLNNSSFMVGGGTGRIKGGIKKASLFAWITLHSVPEETIISPHILDFLEQTLEPIPIPVSQKSFDGNSMVTDGGGGGGGSGVASTYYASFPVDVVVYFHMQPSTFRFSCQPISRVECMLRLPSLDIVFSSKRAEEDADTFCGTASVAAAASKSRSWKTSSSSDFGLKEAKESQQLAVGGLSVTGCLSDFSVYIFHPYGAAKRAGEWSPLSDNERKDSVSMNVEFVKLHLSRSRKIQSGSDSRVNFNSSGHGPHPHLDSQQAAIRFSSLVDIGSASFKYDMRRLTEILAFPKAWYRRSIVRRLFLGDLSTANAAAAAASTYGDENNVPTAAGTPGMSHSGNSSPVFPHKGVGEDRRNSITFGMNPTQREKLRLNLNGEKGGEQRRRGSRQAFLESSNRSRGSHGAGSDGDDVSKEGPNSSGITYWETLVLFTVNFTKLNVHMNMGNVMGNVYWLISGAKSDGRISIGSTGHKNVYVAIGVDSSFIDAKGGIVAGTFELTQLSTFGRVKEDPGIEPHHNLGLKMTGMELRLDFMGTSALMGRVSGLEVNLKDEWHVRSASSGGRRAPPKEDVALATYRPAMVFIHGDMTWDQLQLMISKSTTVDLLKMHCKLEEFFSQQFKSSKYVFSTLQVQENLAGEKLTPSLPRKSKRKLPEGGMWEELKHHRHWQEVLSKVSHMAISSMPLPLPESGTVLGGTMDLHGNNISLACFHGVNFKAKSWALFSLKEPFISFSTEAQETHSSSDVGSVHVVQNLNFSLGGQSSSSLTISSVQHESMAMICKITRNVMFPPQFRTLHEWFHYAFAPSEIDDVQRFPSLEKERERAERERADSGGSSERRTPARLHDPNHNREVIFALPSLELFFKTEHLQACKTPDSGGSRPVVECSFITEFGDHIFVTVDAEAFFFLHDLITSYIKEKEKLVSAQLAAGRSQSPSVRVGDEGGEGGHPSSGHGATPSSSSRSKSTPPSANTSSSSANNASSSSANFGDSSGAGGASPYSLNFELDESALQRDWRDYLCKTWQLEPTVRLLSWAGKSIEPYGVDYILHKLGFSHARITIPKWMQRGFCDPLDKVLSVLVFRMIDIARKEG